MIHNFIRISLVNNTVIGVRLQDNEKKLKPKQRVIFNRISNNDAALKLILSPKRVIIS